MKTTLGQFYTTNYKYIFQNMVLPSDVKHIIEPFAGNGDLLSFIHNKEWYTIECYDIEPKKDYIIQRDTLHNPPCLDDKFVITNPPYLARNKNKDKTLYDKYKCNDLYKCFMINLIHSECKGGIIIIPLNFICSIRKNDINLRKRFLEKFNIITLNIFEEKVFHDTSYTICCLQFRKRNSECYSTPHTIHTTKGYIYPFRKRIELSFTQENNYTIGGEIYKLEKSKYYTIGRATKLTKHSENITNIVLKCIDDHIERKIKLYMVKDHERYIDTTPNLSARSYATLVISPCIDIPTQCKLVDDFNEFIETYRKKYNSLFLNNYRESTTIARKRISFDLAFRICLHLLKYI